MERLDRNNYEVWFIDYLDGQLAPEQVEVLQDFLRQNPDLQQELSGIGEFRLEAGSETDLDKSTLFKAPSDIPGMKSSDQLCIARMENDLSHDESNRFDARLKEDKSLEADYKAFLATRLDPSDDIAYPYKQELRKKVTLFPWWLTTTLSTAAIVVLAIILWPESHSDLTPPIARTENPEPVNKGANSAGQTPEKTEIQQKPLLAQAATVQKERRTASPEMEAVSEHSSKGGKSGTADRQFVPMNRLTRRMNPDGRGIPDPHHMRVLYASNQPVVYPEYSQTDETLTIPQYALRMFRERVLGQDRSLVRSTRFSLWEVAGAGVEKINDLAGTRMKLEREYDDQGSVQSVSFNSRLLDVEAPVK